MLGGTEVQVGIGQLGQYAPFEKAGAVWGGAVHTGKKSHLEEKQLCTGTAISVASTDRSIPVPPHQDPLPPNINLKLQLTGTLR